MKRSLLLSLLILLTVTSVEAKQGKKLNFYSPDHPFIQYTGRIDFSDPLLPRFWQPGVYITFLFKGNECEIVLNDEVLWGNNHNYIELIVDGKEYRLQLKSKSDTLSLSSYISGGGVHSAVVCKNTEANIGYLELAGIRCSELVKSKPKPLRKIEFIGNSITCGMGNDDSKIPCGKGNWYDQHNAWLSYGALTARNVNAQYHLSSVSGIGLMHSCCNMDIIMPAVFDKVSMRNNAIQWDFANYQPDIVTVCLGQNDGVQDSVAFCTNYISFMRQLRQYYPNATFMLLSSPMADEKLRSFLRQSINAVRSQLALTGDNKIFTHVFEKQYISGCDAHPSGKEHKQIATELTTVIKNIMNW